VLVAFSLLQPFVMLALFSQVFSSIATTRSFPAGVDYIDYLMPAILMTTGIGAALQSGNGLLNDMRSGVLARFRSLPIRMGAVLAARGLADLCRTALQLVLLVLCGTALFGLNPAGGAPGLIGTVLVALLVSWSLSWVFLAMAAWLRNVETMQLAGFLVMFPLMFASSAYVPTAGLPGWLQVFAKVNPLTHAVDAARSMALAAPAGRALMWTLLTSLTVLCVGLIAAVKGFNRPVTMAL
jgi:ABC-2 type transport system permease protein